ncbi:MAG: Lacal_2735 family protein [Balneolaceae bacterium]|nr:Lacal_2735 family protein [Balneolaceae bacterium]
MSQLSHIPFTMFGLFKKKSEAEKLNEKYQKLMEESYNLSSINRTLSDQKAHEANEVLKQIDALNK